MCPYSMYWPYGAYIGTTLRPMHIHVSTWTLKVQGILTETPLTEPIGLPV